MTTEQLNSLTEDELSILWFVINKVEPPTLPYEMEPSLFTSIKHNKLIERLNNCKVSLKEESYPIFDSLMAKLAV